MKHKKTYAFKITTTICLPCTTNIFDVKIEMHFDFVSGAPKFSGVPLLIVIKRAEIVKTANTVHVA